MFGWLFKKRENNLEEETKKGFKAVKHDISNLIRWVKHLDKEDKQLFERLDQLKEELATVKQEVEILRDNAEWAVETSKMEEKEAKTAVWSKQAPVVAVQKAVQTAVQTANFYDILKSLSANERMLIFALLNAEDGMKLSYEDLALLLGKEKATVRGQVNAIKQKSEGLIGEKIEKNGKKRLYIPEEIRLKLKKYAKVRVKKSKSSD